MLFQIPIRSTSPGRRHRSADHTEVLFSRSSARHARRNLDSPLPQHLKNHVAVDQFAALSLGEACLNIGGDGFAPLKHPVFEIELLADDLKSLIENLAGVLIPLERTAKSITRCCSGFRSIEMVCPLETNSLTHHPGTPERQTPAPQ
jgi:hypothetical protein